MSGIPPIPTGFRAAGLHCGIKKSAQELDLALFVSDCPAVAAGVFTTNRVCGAPVVVSRQRVPSERVRGVLLNSGNANACTGEQGLADAGLCTGWVAERLGCSAEEMLVCSTGVIGRRLPMGAIEAGVPRLLAALDSGMPGFENAARAIMTTDTVPKQRAQVLDVAGRRVVLHGVAKGAAMIAPNMATMLAVLLTDAQLDSQTATEMLRRAVDRTFNRITVDGHTSTSDTVLLLANGGSEVDCSSPPHQAIFERALETLAGELAEAIIRDAEGATHFISVTVQGAATENDASQIARAIANSPLVKTAIAGADPNWGRIVSAAGYAGIPFQERELSLSINGELIYDQGTPLEIDLPALSRSIRENRDTFLEVTLSAGEGACRILTSDLTTEYVRLNADYTT